MNILILSTHLRAGGISRYILNLSSGLVKKFNNVFCASSGGEWVKILEGIGCKHKYIPINTKSIFSIKIILSFFSLISFIRKNKIQIIHCNSRVTQCLGYFLYKFLSIPYISVFHGFYRPSMFRKLFKFSGLRTIAVSNSVKKHLISDLCINEEKIKVIYNGLDIKKFSLNLKQKSFFGFKEDDFLIGILGRISKEKGHFLAVNSIKEISSKYSNVYLIICGKGRLEKKLKTFIEESKIKNIRFIDIDAEDFLDIIDLLIVPSIKEGFGYSIIEAFAKGVPVIGFNVGGIAELIRDGENGILFNEYSSVSLRRAIELIINNKVFRETLIMQAKKDVVNFSIENMVDNTLGVYREVLGKKNI